MSTTERPDPLESRHRPLVLPPDEFETVRKVAGMLGMDQPAPALDAWPMWRRRYVDVQAVLDKALGDEEGGDGIAADVALLAAQRDQAVARRDAAYAELEDAVRERTTAEAKLAEIHAYCRDDCEVVNEGLRLVAIVRASDILAIIDAGEPARPRVTVDLNVRVRKHETYSGFDDVAGADPAALRWGDRVLAVEVESRICSDAIVAGVDLERRLVYLVPDWHSWRDDPAIIGSEEVCPGGC